MNDVIRLLPESIANQIAAGEVVPGPSYVVKELLENAIDAGATNIKLEVSEGGKACIHVIDNGKGMSPTDARMAFEKHATSKISTSEDLYRLCTMGFRGEALAAIAAVARVELNTRPHNNDLGTKILIAGSEVSSVEVVATAAGTSIQVRDIFFNTPARRRFLKSISTEYRAILREFERVALVNPQVAMSLYKDGTLDIDLPASSLKKRIIQLEGAKLEKDLLPIQYESEMIRISGYIGKPSGARPKGARQFLFVNNRYMEHRLFRSAIMQSYEALIPAKYSPNFFVYFSLPPENIDVNINPTKTEVRFVDETIIWQILQSLVREALSAHAAVPLIDFSEQVTNIPTYTGRKELTGTSAIKPEPRTTYGRRVFMGMHSAMPPIPDSRPTSSPQQQDATSYNIDWDSLGESFQNEGVQSATTSYAEETPLFGIREMERNSNEPQIVGHLIYKNRYVVTPLRGGLALIDFSRAMLRIQYDRFVEEITEGRLESQQVIYPDTSSLTEEEADAARALLTILQRWGFDYEVESGNYLKVTAAPQLILDDATDVILTLIAGHLEGEHNSLESELISCLALIMSEFYVRRHKVQPNKVNIEEFLAGLFASSDAHLSPNGKKIIVTLAETELERLFTQI